MIDGQPRRGVTVGGKFARGGGRPVLQPGLPARTTDRPSWSSQIVLYKLLVAYTAVISDAEQVGEPHWTGWSASVSWECLDVIRPA